MQAFAQVLKNSKGTAAIEFAIIAPLFLLVVFSIISYGLYLSTANTIEQMAADAARTAVAGLTEAERQALATQYITATTADYPFLDREKLAVEVKDDPANKNQFTVSLSYDARGLPIWTLFAFALPEPDIRRYATIRLGGI